MMRKPTVALLNLTVALVASNVFWLYRMVDNDVTMTYTQDSLETCRRTALQALALLPVAARPDATVQSVRAAARKGQEGSEPFEKEGFTWVGDIGLRFDESGRVAEARPAVDPF